MSADSMVVTVALKFEPAKDTSRGGLDTSLSSEVRVNGLTLDELGAEGFGELPDDFKGALQFGAQFTKETFEMFEHKMSEIEDAPVAAES